MKEERDFFVVTDENGVVIATREIRKGVITEADVIKDVLENKDKAIILVVTEEECKEARIHHAEPISERLMEKIEEKKTKGEIHERPKKA